MKRYSFSIFALHFALVTVWLSPAIPVIAQEPADSSAIWHVETFDGNEYFGSLIERTNEFVKIETEKLGLLTIPTSEIRTIEVIQSSRIKNGEFWSENPQATRYFWAPNGFSLKRGEGYYQNVWVFFNHLAVGLSNNVSLGVGLVPTFLFEGAPTPVWVTPKISLSPTDPDARVRLGIGTLLGTILGEDSGTFGIAYGVATFGSRDANLNVGVGMGFADGGWAERPAISVSAMLRASRRGYFVTENYLLSDGESSLGLISFGGRMVGKNMSFDLGLVIPVEDSDISVAVPWLGISVPMGKKQP